MQVLLLCFHHQDGKRRHTHTIIEGSLPARRWSKTVGRRAKQYDFPKPAGSATNTSRPLTNSSIAFSCWCFKLSKPNACTAASIAASICSLLYLTMSTWSGLRDFLLSGLHLVVEANFHNQHLSRNFCSLDTSTLGYLPDPPSLPFAPPRRRGWGRDYCTMGSVQTRDFPIIILSSPLVCNI